MIKKYTLTKYGITQFKMKISTFLSAQMQNDELVMWIDDNTPYEELWTIYSVFTGDDAPVPAIYVGTVQDRSVVYHVYAQL